MDIKSRISLTSEQETLLITLYARAQPENPLFFDPKAQEILNQIDYDFTKLKMPLKQSSWFSSAQKSWVRLPVNSLPKIPTR